MLVTLGTFSRFSELTLSFQRMLFFSLHHSLFHKLLEEMGRNIRRNDFWDHLLGQVLAMIVNGCLEYSRPMITEAAPPKRSQNSLNPKLVPIPLRVSEDDNFDLPLGEKGGILFHFSSFASRVCLAHSRVTGTRARQFWTQLFEDQLALTRARG